MYFCEQFLLVCIQGRVQNKQELSFRITILVAKLVARFRMAKDFSMFSSALLPMIFLIQKKATVITLIEGKFWNFV